MRVGGAGQQRPLRVVLDPRVVTRGERVGAEALGEREHRVEAHLAVAAHARVRRAPRVVLGHEGRRPRRRGSRPRGRASGAAGPWSARARARSEHRLRRAAAALAVALLVGPELQRHGDDLGARRARTSSAATALSTPPLIATSTRPARRRRERRVACGAGRGERAVQRIGGEVGGVELPRREAAQLGRRRRRRRRAPPPARRGPRPATRPRCRPRSRPRSRRRRTSTSAMRPSRTTSATRTRSPHGAPPALPTCAPAGTGPRPGRLAQVLLEGMHPESRRCLPPKSRRGRI